jgi:hypothetical protein
VPGHVAGMPPFRWHPDPYMGFLEQPVRVPPWTEERVGASTSPCPPGWHWEDHGGVAVCAPDAAPWLTDYMRTQTQTRGEAQDPTLPYYIALSEAWRRFNPPPATLGEWGDGEIS